MDKISILKDLIKMSESLVCVINIKEKNIELTDGESSQIVGFNDFPKYVAEKFDLVCNFNKKLRAFLDKLDPTKDRFSLPGEYNSNDGTLVNLIYNGYKQSSDEFLLVISINPNDTSENLDELTKAHSRGYIVQKTNAAIVSQTPFAILLVDIDYFKHFNDTYGHMFGDVILIELVAECKKLLGDRGSISRIGGDEFIIFVNVEDDYDRVHELCFEIKQSLQKISATAIKGSKITVTIGSAQYPSDGDSFELLLRKCDKALYRGKKKGRDCFVMYTLDKCGPVSLDDDFNQDVGTIDKYTAKNNVYSLIAGVNQFLNDENDFERALDDALNLVGNYFYLDRVSIARLDPKIDRIKKHNLWHNPSTVKHFEPLCNDDIIPKWRDALGEKEYLQMANVKDMKEDFPLTEEFAFDHTTACMAFELRVNDTIYGIIRYEMTTGKRHWQPEDYQVFMLLSRLFAMYINRDYIREATYQQLYFDPIFGCYNYSKFFIESARYVVANRQEPFSVLNFVINDYVRIINIIGKRRMFEVIKVIISEMATFENVITCKKADSEFVIFFMDNDDDLIAETFDKINIALEKHSKKENIPRVTIQGGVYIAQPREALANAIDMAVLTRTENKNGDLQYYSKAIHDNVIFRSQLAYHIDDALANNEFMLYLQPKVSTHTDDVVGAEALTRWNYKHEKMIFPDTFIPVFEENGIIAKLDYSVFENVCIFQRRMMDSGKKLIPISVNVSRYVSNFNDYLRTIEEIRRKYEVSPNYIEIEITEGMYYSNTNEISSFIENLHKTGYRVSMDDFGSGYSNFTSLADLNFDTIKLDKSFCHDLDSKKSQIMVLKIMELVKALNMETLCEGVETAQNVEYLKGVGCDLIQGYYYSKPIPAEEFEDKYFK